MQVLSGSREHHRSDPDVGAERQHGGVEPWLLVVDEPGEDADRLDGQPSPLTFAQPGPADEDVDVPGSDIDGAVAGGEHATPADDDAAAELRLAGVRLGRVEHGHHPRPPSRRGGATADDRLGGSRGRQGDESEDHHADRPGTS